MSRSGYTDDGDDWSYIKWRGQVASALRGKRGQRFLRELIAALEALPEKRLAYGAFNQECGVCALGAVAQMKGIDISDLEAAAASDDLFDYNVGARFDIAQQLALEVMYENDEADLGFTRRAPNDPKTQAIRYQRMLRWAEEHVWDWEVHDDR